MKTPELLDAARQHAGIPSDYALAARLGVTRATVSGWRNQRSFPDSTHALALADLAGLDWPAVFAALELHRAEMAHLDVNVAAWRSILKRLGTSGGAVAGALAAATVAALLADPSALHLDHSGFPVIGLYIMSSRRRRRPGGRAVMAALARALVGSPLRSV